ncbi:MAG: HAD family hydrolase, partial [Erysipelotrichaceae bacterium]|nr:HAD family hydrolase [Erysipelotrichaceae bacterium]
YRIAIASMSPRRKIDQVLSLNHWEEFVDLYVASDDVERLKPDPDSYLKAMNKLGMQSNECIVIEDSQVGIDAAHGAGCRYICHREQRYPIEQTGADYYIDDLLDALGIINEMN